jgi:hypothetical protein
VPDRTVNRSDSRSLTGIQGRRPTCAPADQRPRTRSLPSWWRRPLAARFSRPCPPSQRPGRYAVAFRALTRGHGPWGGCDRGNGGGAGHATARTSRGPKSPQVTYPICARICARDAARRSERPETHVVWLITQRLLAERSTGLSRLRADGGTPGLTPEGIASREAKLALVLPVGSDGRRLGRGTSRGTGGSEIPGNQRYGCHSACFLCRSCCLCRRAGPS